MALQGFTQVLRDCLDGFCDVRPLSNREKMRAMNRLLQVLDDSNVVPIDSKAADALAATFIAHELLAAKEELVLGPDARPWAELLSGRINELHHAQYMAYRFVDNLPDMARRAAAIRMLFVEKKPSARTLSLCREAYQAYTHGFFVACVATVRSVIESALSEAIGADVSGLSPLIRGARSRNLINDDTERRLKKVKRIADDALHTGNSPSEVESLKVLSDAQLILDRLVKRLAPR
jgi:hypothetical protein